MYAELLEPFNAAEGGLPPPAVRPTKCTCTTRSTIDGAASKCVPDLAYLCCWQNPDDMCPELPEQLDAVEGVLL